MCFARWGFFFGGFFWVSGEASSVSVFLDVSMSSVASSTKLVFFFFFPPLVCFLLCLIISLHAALFTHFF